MDIWRTSNRSVLVPIIHLYSFMAVYQCRLEAFRALKLSKSESFRALKFSSLESVRALNTLLVFYSKKGNDLNRFSCTCIIYLASQGSLTKSGQLLNLRALKLSNLESFRAIKHSNLATGYTSK